MKVLKTNMNKVVKVDGRPVRGEDGKFKISDTFEAGSTVDLTFENGGMIVSQNGVSIKCKASSYPRYFGGKVPSMASLEKMVEDGIAKSVTGKRCEPDGYGPDGSPSWLLALGLI